MSRDIWGLPQPLGSGSNGGYFSAEAFKGGADVLPIDCPLELLGPGTA